MIVEALSENEFQWSKNLILFSVTEVLKVDPQCM